MRQQTLWRKRLWLSQPKVTSKAVPGLHGSTWLERILWHVPFKSLVDSTVRVLVALRPCPASPGPPTTLPAQGLRGSISAQPWAFGPFLSYAVDVFVSSSVPSRPLPGHEPCWSPAHGLIHRPDLRPASSPWTCLMVTLPCLRILSRSPKTDFQRLTHEEQAKKCRWWQYATFYICLYEMRYILIKDFCKFRNGSLRSKYWSGTEKPHTLHSRAQKGDKSLPNQMRHGWKCHV